MHLDVNKGIDETIKKTKEYLPNSSLSDSINDMGVEFYNKGKIDKAFSCFLLSYHLSKNVNSAFNLIDILTNLSLFSTAIKYLERIISSDPDDFELYQYLNKIKKEKELFNIVHGSGTAVINNFEHLPVLMYLHIPKTAGSTLWYILNNQYPISRFHHHIGTVHYINEFKKKSETERNSFDIIAGHLHYGIHNYINREVIYFTMLRNPIERAISDYYYVLNNPENYFHKYVVDNKISLREFVETECHNTYPHLDNGQVQLISGIWKNSDDKVDKNMLEMAKNNLKNKFVAVGINEEFDAFLLLLKQKLGWSLDPFYVSQNITKSRPKISEINDATKEIIKEKNKYDFELYNFAKEIFDEEKKMYGSSLDNDVREFKYLNDIYSSYLK